MNFLLETLRLGLTNLMLHKLRSVLTSLGIILGVAAVIIMVSIGEGNKQAALREIQALGATNIIVRSTKPPETASPDGQERSFVASFGLKRADLRRLEHLYRELGADIISIVPLKAVGGEISYHARRMTSQSFGVTPELRTVANLRTEPRGRYITQQDIDSNAPVAVIGSEVAKSFFPLEDPLGKVMRIDDRVFTIVGVLQPIGLAGGTGSALVGRDWNKDVHIPLTTAELEFGDIVMRRQAGSFSGEEVELSEIYATAGSTETVIETANLIRQTIAVAHPNFEDVQIIVPWELLESAKRTALVWNIVLISIAAISLLIGGIGIMNIMLASVTERTREIGIRRALGATRKHIIAQFLVETGSLSAVGGLIGIGIGVGVSVGVRSVLPWVLSLPALRDFVDRSFVVETQVTAWSIGVSFAVAALVGLVFGIYPAVIASRQDPIVALRHD
jgi:putative ABC transport system permease protein